MPTQSPAQEFSTQINSLQNDIKELQEEVRLTSVRNTVEDIQSKITGLSQKITTIRTRGYVFDKHMENEASALSIAWKSVYPTIITQIQSQSNSLIIALRPVESQITQLISRASVNPNAARNSINITRATVEQLESKINASKEIVEVMYDNFNDRLYGITRRITDIEYLQNNLAEATFTLYPTESGVMAVKAVWFHDGKEDKGDPEGVLYLTDQRLLFEQKEELVTKKVLFIATEKKKMQSLLLEVPVVVIDIVNAEKTGLLKKDDQIKITFLTGAPLDSTCFHIWQDSSKWQGMINRAKAKEFDNDRISPVDQEIVEKVKNAPVQCPSCGGGINKPILRGQDSIKCEYCGFIIRI